MFLKTIIVFLIAYAIGCLTDTKDETDRAKIGLVSLGIGLTMMLTKFLIQQGID